MSVPELYFALRRTQAWLSHRLRRTLGLNKTVYVNDRVPEYRSLWQNAAHQIGADFVALTETIWEIRLGERRTRVCNYLVPLDDPVTLRVAGDKMLCYAFARDLGIPTPRPHSFGLAEREAARELLASEPGAYVVKPAGASAGLGISTDVRTRGQLDDAILLASLYSREFIIERLVPAETIRLLFLHGELIHAARRRGVRVTGDGRSSVRQLLAASGLQRLVTDPTTRITLEARSLSLDTVLETDAEILARCLPADVQPVPELRTIYNESITDEIGRDLVEELQPLVRVVGVQLAGVDILTADPSVSLARSGGVLLEINTTPGLHHHVNDERDQTTSSAAVAVLRDLLRVDAPGA